MENQPKGRPKRKTNFFCLFTRFFIEVCEWKLPSGGGIKGNDPFRSCALSKSISNLIIFTFRGVQLKSLNQRKYCIS